MQVAAQPAALLLPGEHEPLLGGADGVEQAGGVDDGAELAGEVDQEPAVGVAQRPPRPGEGPDLDAVRRHRQTVDVARRPCRGGPGSRRPDR